MTKIGAAIGDQAVTLNKQFVDVRTKEEQETMSMVDSVLLSGGISAVVSIALGLLIALVISVGIARLITRITSTMEVLVTGNFNVTVPETGRRDEIGAMARAVEVFRRTASRPLRWKAKQSSSAT